MTDKLTSLRGKIDLLDRRIAALLGRRFALAASLKDLKKKVTDKPRERRVLANAAGAAGGGRSGRAARAVFREIIKQSKGFQS